MGLTLTENQPCEVITGQWQSFDCHLHKKEASGTPKLELADVFRQFEKEFLDEYDDALSSAQRRVMKSIMKCRTAAVGGHLEHCYQCGNERSVYNSCRDRHCPKCQFLPRAQWLEDRRAEMLAVPYYHLVFKIPEEIEEIAFQNRKVVFNLFLHAVAETLKGITAMPKYLGAEIGFMLQLQTASESVKFHPHIHCVIPAGGLSFDGERWVPGQHGFVPARVLACRFRKLFLGAMRKAFRKLEFFGRLARLRDFMVFDDYLNRAKRKDWDVHVGRPIESPERVLQYMSRHAQSGAIGNDRLLKIKDDQVLFEWKDYRIDNQVRQMSLRGVELMRRVLLHVMPRGFKNVRYYGFMSSTSRRKLALCHRLLGMPTLSPLTKPEKSYSERYQDLTGLSLGACPRCGYGEMIVVKMLPKAFVPYQVRVNSS
jgi:hypothetical protein